jgi:thioredoxin 1
MKTGSKKTLLLTGAVVLLFGLLATQGQRAPRSGCCCPSIVSLGAFAAETAKASGTNVSAKTALPRLVDLGADKCIPCKLMAPVLADLKTNYVGQLEVEFIDVWKNPDAAKPYKLKLIPTQILYDTQGKELFRHQGFFSKEDILAKWKELGVELKTEGRNPKAEGR